MADILPGKPTKEDKTSSVRPVAYDRIKQEATTREKDKTKMQTIYLKENDIDEAADIIHLVTKTHRAKGRVGLSRVLRAGLKQLAKLSPEEQVEAVIAVGEEE